MELVLTCNFHLTFFFLFVHQSVFTSVTLYGVDRSAAMLPLIWPPPVSGDIAGFQISVSFPSSMCTVGQLDLFHTRTVDVFIGI